MKAFLGVLFALITLAGHSLFGQCTSPFLTDVQVTGTASVSLTWFDSAPDTTKTYELELVALGSTPTGVPSVSGLKGTTHVLTNLLAGTAYDVFIRASCAGETSTWNGPVRFVTHLENGASCGINLPINDNSCPEEQVFPIVVSNSGGTALGDNVFLRGISLIIAHGWLADLTLQVESPNGQRVLLTASNGVGIQNFGDPNDTLCQRVMTFADDACVSVTDIDSLFLGTFIPEQALEQLHDGSSPDGTWKLIICDKAQDDVGTLLHANLDFETDFCQRPPVINILHTTHNSAIITMSNNAACDSIYLLLSPGILTADSLQLTGSTSVVLCNSDTVELIGLASNAPYTLQAIKQCNPGPDAPSCVFYFETACAEITVSQNFDDLDGCLENCTAPCPFPGFWQNISSDDFDWIVRSGPTPTQFTGPENDIGGDGNYIYLETSGAECQNESFAILESECFQINASAGQCHFSFWAHMSGTDIGTLAVEVSPDAGRSWFEMILLDGAQGDAWNQYFIDLSEFDGTLARIRFLGSSDLGQFGDIALDAFALYGSLPVSSLPVYYRDLDRDGFGNIADSACLCTNEVIIGFSSNGLDCNDTLASINPDATEIPCNLVDENCNGPADDAVLNDPLTITLNALTNVSCSGFADGQLEISLSGGTVPYSYDWGLGLDTNRLSGLDAGLYQCTVTDFNGCLVVSDSFRIEVSDVLNFFVIEMQDPSCPGALDGSMTNLLTGGSPPFAFLWSNGDTTLNLIEIGVGTYTLTITDQVGCTLVSEPIVVAAVPTFQSGVLEMAHVSCAGADDGSILLGQIGGIPPYAFQWSNGDSTQLIENLPPGTYACTVTDQAGCSVIIDSVLITEPPPLDIVIDALDIPSCAGESDGSIQITAIGGTPGYFYNWSNAHFSDDQFNVSAGSYALTITDSRSCQIFIGEIVLPDPDSLVIEHLEVTHVNCPGNSDGSIVVQVSGGAEPYAYFWSQGGEGSDTLNDLGPGMYSVTISDQRGCKVSEKFIDLDALNPPLGVTLNTTQEIPCFGDSLGAIVAAVESGTAPFRFNWSAGVQNTSDTPQDTLNSLPADQYSVTVTDAFGCVGSAHSFDLNQPDPLHFMVTHIVDNPCFGYREGRIDLIVGGGTPEYLFTWNNGASTKNLDSLAAGSYLLTVTDANACILSLPPIEIHEPDSVFIIFEAIPAVGAMQNGSATVNIVQGGFPPFSYVWDDNAGSQSGQTADSLTSGWYQVTISDDAGCTYVDSVFIDVVNSVLAPGYQIFSIHPNPAIEVLTIRSDDPLEWDAIRVYSLLGRRVNLPVEWINEDEVQIHVAELIQGVYYVSYGGHSVPFIKLDK